MNHINNQERIPLATMDSAMEDSQPSVFHRMEADRESEAEDIHENRVPNNTVYFHAGIKEYESTFVSSGCESDGGMQELDGGNNSPMQCSSNIGNDPHDHAEVMSNSLSPVNTAEEIVQTPYGPCDLVMIATNSPANNDVRDEQSIFVDSEGDTNVGIDATRSVKQQDSQIEEDIGSGSGSIKSFVCPQTTQIISKHLSTPSQQSFKTLNDLLSSHNAPGRGLYSVEKVLEHEEARADELEEKMKEIAAELEEVKARRDRAEDIVRNADSTFSKARSAAGIHDQLWKEYEAFCQSLEPKFGNRGGWSVTCFENHGGSYVKWDPSLELFIESAEMSLGSCNFRCEATTVERMGRTEYVVEFWPLANLEARSETARTWRQQYVSNGQPVSAWNYARITADSCNACMQPKLYRLAEQAANRTSQGSSIAKALFQSLPDPDLLFFGGWLFEYALEPGRAHHPTISRRWSYRSACKIFIDSQQDREDDTALSESGSAASQDEDMDYDESEAPQSQDVNMEDEESELTEGQDMDMEDDD